MDTINDICMYSPCIKWNPLKLNLLKIKHKDNSIIVRNSDSIGYGLDFNKQKNKKYLKYKIYLSSQINILDLKPYINKEIILKTYIYQLLDTKYKLIATNIEKNF